MHTPFPPLDSCNGRNFPNPDRVRHAEVGEGAEDDRTHMALGHLPVERTGEESITQLLESVHPIFGDATPVIVRVFLPARTPLVGDLGQDGIQGMLVSSKHCALTGRGRRLGNVLEEGAMHAFGVIRAIGRDLAHIPFDLHEQVREDFAVVPVGRGHFDTDDVLGRGVDRQMDIAPGATLAYAVPANFPLALAEDFQTGGIHHDMRGTHSRTARNRHFQRGCQTQQVGVVRHRRQIQAIQSHQRLNQSFGGPPSFSPPSGQSSLDNPQNILMSLICIVPTPMI